MSISKGKFAWYELMTTDTSAAGSFYSAVVGWKTTDAGSAESPYTCFNVGDTGVAGLMGLPEEAGPTPAWIGYIHVDHLEPFIEQVTAAGGELHKGPVDVPGMLRFAVVNDPQGAPFVLFTPDPGMATPPNRPLPPTPGTIGWCELMAGDGPAAFDFYTQTFGWDVGNVHDMGPMGTYQTFDVEGVQTGGIMTKPPYVPSPFWNYYIQVENIQAAHARVLENHGTVLMGPQEVPGGGWVIQATDPQGALFCLLGPGA